MIYFDVTKMGGAKHRSGLMRVSCRLREELGAAAVEVVWRDRIWRHAQRGDSVRLRASDWLLVAELFCEAERPGFWKFLQEKPCRLAAIFHDAIPLKHPHITWPQSVARQPEYMKMLAAFDRVFAVSQTSREELTQFWRWQGLEGCATVETIQLGADFLKRPRPSGLVAARANELSLVSVGILEPRKNQMFLLDVCEALWCEGLVFELHLVGRVNPHFGQPVKARVAALRKSGRRVSHHKAMSDEALLALYKNARASVFPTIAEGCGLPVLESLWLGVPCVCSDLPVLRENADDGGCVVLTPNDTGAWVKALRRVLADADWAMKLRGEAAAGRVLPTWAQTAQTMRAILER
jgi:glycosyltransferase involved in cell wall biosynthesis